MKPGVLALLVVLLATPGTVGAQVNGPPAGGFNANPHPGMPWSGVPNPNNVAYGKVIRYIAVPPQQVQIQVYVPGPGSFSGGFEQQVVEIPGYVVTETTTGFIYPEHLTLRQISPGAWEWVRLPQTFQPK